MDYFKTESHGEYLGPKGMEMESYWTFLFSKRDRYVKESGLCRNQSKKTTRRITIMWSDDVDSDLRIMGIIGGFTD